MFRNALLFFGGICLIAIPAGAQERPVDTKILCGGLEAYAKNVAYIQQRSDDPGSVVGINPDFACNLAAFMAAAPGTIRTSVVRYEVTRSAARGDDCKRFQCIEGTNSHPKGLAADLIYNGDDTKPSGPGSVAQCQRNPLCSWAHANAAAYGLQFRLMPGSPCFPGAAEAWHIELRGVGCDAAGGSGGFGGLLNGIAGLLGNALSPQKPQPAQQPPLATLPTTTLNSTSSIGISQIFATTSVATTSSPRGGTLTADRLEELAFGVRPTTTRPTASVPIVVSGGNATSLSGTQTTGTNNATGDGARSSAQSTFSADLSWQTQTTPSSPFATILTSIRLVLTKLLAIMIPFNGSVQENNYIQ